MWIWAEERQLKSLSLVQKNCTETDTIILRLSIMDMKKKYVLFAQSMASGGFLHIIFLTGINAQPAAEDKELQEMFLYTEAEKSMKIDMTIQKSNIKD